MKVIQSTKKPTYSLEFKQDAAKLVLEKGCSQQQAADHLGVSLSALSRWVIPFHVHRGTSTHALYWYYLKWLLASS